MSIFAKKIFVSAIAAVMIAAFAVPPAAQAQTTIADLQAQIAALLAQITQLQTQLNNAQGGGSTGGGVSGIPAGFTFDRNLTVGSSGNDVMYLQMLLNSNSSTMLGSSGAGSPGSETTFFGPITRSGVIKFQDTYRADVLTPVGLTSGTGFFGPSTRTKANSLLSALPPPPPPTPTPTPSPTPGTPPPPPTPPVVTPPSGNALNVTLASDTPASATVADAANANFTKLWLTAGSSEVSISSIDVMRYGLAANADVENIKVLDENGVKVGTLGTLNTNNKAKLTFSPAMKVAANSSKIVFIRAGIVDATSAGKTVALGIDSASDINAGGASVEGSFPIKGNSMSVVLLTIGSLTAKEDGALTDSQPDIGDTDVIVNAFKLVAGSTEGIMVDQITVEESGSASLSDTNNIELWDVTNNVSMGTTQWTAGGKASWSGLSIDMNKGDTRRFRVQLDIINGSGLTVNADLMDGDDVLVSAKGKDFGFFITPAGNAASDWSNSNNGLANANQTIQSGSLTISKDTSTPATGNIAQADDVVLAVFDFLVKGESVKITSLKVSLNLATMVETEVTNVEILDASGSILAGPKDVNATDVTGANSTTYEGSVTFTDTIILPVGSNPLTVRADISTATSASDTIQIGISDADATDITAKGMTTNDTITPGPANTEVNGNVQTIDAGSLAMNTLAAPLARSIAKGVQDFVFSVVSLDATGSGEDVQVTALTVTNTPTSLAAADEIDNTELWADMTADNSVRGDVYETRVGNAKQFDESTDATADTLAFTLNQTITVPKDGSVNVAIVGDVNTGAGIGNHVMKISAGTVTGKSTGSSITATFAGSGQAMTVAASGTLTTAVSASPTNPSSDILISGSTDVTLAAFKLTADNVEDLDLDKVILNVTGGDRVATYKFYNGATLLGTASGGTATTAHTFTKEFPDNTLVIPASENKTLTVKANLNVGTDLAGDNDIDVIVALSDGSSTAGNNIQATGKASGATTSDSNDRIGNTHQYYFSRPYFSVNSASPSGDVLSPTDTEIVAIFDIRAHANEDITFQSGDSNQMVVTVSISANDSNDGADTFTLKDGDGTSLDSVTIDVASGGAQTLTFDFTDSDFTIPAGTTKPLWLYGDLSDLEDDGDSIKAWLDDGTATNLDYGIDGEATDSDRADIIWRGDIFAGTLVNPS
jgi:hypothetical protein